MTYPTNRKERKQWREDKGLTQEQLAELVGCCTSTVVKWEGGRANPSSKAFLRKLTTAEGETNEPRN